MTDDSFRIGLDAAIACVLSLGEEKALQRIERQYLGNSAAEYADRYAAIMAVRAHQSQWQQFSQGRLAQALRHVLVTPELADLIIPDLAKWQDWSVIPRLVELFENADEETHLVRVPILKYLLQCPEPSAAEALARLTPNDPGSLRLAEEQLAAVTTRTDQEQPVAIPQPVAIVEPPQVPPLTAPEAQSVHEKSVTTTQETAPVSHESNHSWISLGALFAVGGALAALLAKSLVRTK